MQAKTFAIGGDHSAVQLKEEIKKILAADGWEIIDYGTNTATACDYSDIAQAVARAIASGKCARGILICGTGLGMSYAANRFRGVRAAVCWSCEVAALAREHNDSNLLVLPARARTLDPINEIVKTWLTTAASTDERHQRRIAKIENYV